MRRTIMLLTIIALGCLAAAASAEEKAPAYTFKFSGYFKGDLVYDQSRVNAGNYAVYVLDKPENDYMNITARESRFGLDFSWKENEIRTDARFEFDFYGLGVSSATLNSQENKAAPMLRHAFVQITKGRWSLLAGQTSDIISPLAPRTVNYTVLWDQGNIGYRRPQFRISAWADASERARLSAAVGAFRTLGGDLDDDKIDDGADAAVPTVEGRIAMAVKLGEKRSFEIGFSGHYGTEQYQAVGVTKDVDSWSGNADLKLSLCGRVELAGELFMGENLGAYYGGVGQTVNPLKEEIGARGGWAELSYKPVDRLWLNAGYGIDDPDDEDFVIAALTTSTKSFIARNTSVFGSVMYDLTSTVTAMFEVSQLETRYLYKVYVADELKSDEKDFDDVRVQFAIKAAIK
jgi:hypothetical protein